MAVDRRNMRIVVKVSNSEVGILNFQDFFYNKKKIKIKKFGLLMTIFHLKDNIFVIVNLLGINFIDAQTGSLTSYSAVKLSGPNLSKIQ